MPTLATARAQRFHAYVERLTTALGHRDRHGPLRAYVTGLCLPGERKSIEPMAARVDPRHVRARHESMHHFVANAAWDDGAILRAARETVLAALERHGPAGWRPGGGSPLLGMRCRRGRFRASWASAPGGGWGRPAARRCPRRGIAATAGRRRWSAAPGDIDPSACGPWPSNCQRGRGVP